MVELVYDAVHYFFENKWDPTDFIKTAKFKPKTIEEILDGKGNKSVLQFADRMSQRSEIEEDKNLLLEPHTRFKYIIAKKYPITHNYRGCKEDLKVGARMEYLWYALKNGMDIDKNYYMDGSIITQLARVLIYHDAFYIEATGDTDEEMKKADEKMVKAAKKHLAMFIKKKNFDESYVDVGPVKKAIFKKANETMKDAFDDIFGRYGRRDFDNLFLNWDGKVAKSFDIIKKKVNTMVNAATKKYSVEFMTNYRQWRIDEIANTKLKYISYIMRKYDVKKPLYNFLVDSMERQYGKAEKEFRVLFKDIMKISNKYKNGIGIISGIIENDNSDGSIGEFVKKCQKPVSKNNTESVNNEMSELKNIKMSTVVDQRIQSSAVKTLESLRDGAQLSKIYAKLEQIKLDMYAAKYSVESTIKMSEYATAYKDKLGGVNIISSDTARSMRAQAMATSEELIDEIDISF